MRTTGAVLLVSSALLLEACGGCHEADLVATDTDTTEEEEVFENDVGQWLSMAVTPDGAPAISYYDRTDGAVGYAVGTVADGAVTWERSGVDGYAGDGGLDPGDVGLYTSLAIASDGTVWVAYQDQQNTTLKVGSRAADADEWTLVTADTGSGSGSDVGLWNSLALDSSGNPVVAHFDDEEGALRLSTWNGSGFGTEVLDEGEDAVGDTGEVVEARVGEYAKVFVDGSTVYVAYYDAANGDLKLSVNGAVEVVDSDGDVGAWPDIAKIGSDIVIAYQDVGEQDLKVATGSSGQWSIETVDTGSWVGADAAIYDGGIFYFDGDQNDLKQVAGSPGSYGSPATVAGSDAALGYHTETVLSGSTRYVACYDYTNRDVWFAAL